MPPTELQQVNWCCSSLAACFHGLGRRSLHKMPNRLDAKFQVPVFMVMGEKDYAFKFPGFETAMRSGAMETFAPDLKITYIPEGSHFVQEQLPEQVNELLLGFLKDHPVVAA